MTPGLHLAGGVTSIVLGLAVGVAAWVASGGWLVLLPVSWAMTLHGMRNLRMMIYHQCAHRNMFDRRRLDSALGQVIAALLIVQNLADYSREHVGEHHSVHHMTLRDPTVQAFLISLRLRPGLTRRQMWRRVLGRLASPIFQARFAVARVRSFARRASWAERVIAIVVYVGGGVATALTGTWPAAAVLWLLPLFPLFQISNTLRLCVKHTFPRAGTTRRKGREYFASLTNAIFIGEAAPEPGLRPLRTVARWAVWSSRMLFIHFPSRYLVLTGDTVVHDYHHRYPSSRGWADYIFGRQEDMDNGTPGWPPYHAEWGLVAAINRVFDSLSEADPDEFDVTRIGAVSQRELFNAFDD